MNIDKAISKQKKSYKIFMLSMCFIFFMLPLILFLSRKINLFYIIYLIILELLIFLAILIRTNNESLKFQCNGYRLKIVTGINKNMINIICDKVVLVHIERFLNTQMNFKDFKIVILATSRFRSSRMLSVNIEFLKKHPYVAEKYNELKKVHPEKTFYYTVVKRAGIKKYPLLDTIYKNCVHAIFTEEAIDEIKYYRDNSEKYNFSYM